MALVFALGIAGQAQAETKVVSLDDLAPETNIQDQYKESDGVFFRGPSLQDGWFPRVKSAPGQAHSGDRVASIANCEAGGNSCEFFTPVTIGRLTRTASVVSAYVGWIGSPGASTAEVKLVARDGAGGEIDTSTGHRHRRAVVPFSQRLTVSSPSPNIASFEIIASPSLSEEVGFDDLALTYPDAPAPPDPPISATRARVASLWQSEVGSSPACTSPLGGLRPKPVASRSCSSSTHVDRRWSPRSASPNGPSAGAAPARRMAWPALR